MQKQTWSGVFVAAVFAASGVVMAQSPATQAPSSAAPQAASANRVTVTGCLREAGPATAATSGSTATTPSPTDSKGNASTEPKYVLADAAPSGSNASAAGAATSAPRTYRLIANDAALAPHVGKKLEFTGTIEGDASASGEQRMHVESASVLGGTCTP